MTAALRITATLAILAAGSTTAEIGALDAVPCATLLVPYFEVDLNAADGMTTIVNVNNSDASPVDVKATLWTDLAVATKSFDFEVGGWAVEAIDLRQVFSGLLPDDGSLMEDEVAALVAAHTGQADPDSELCSGVAMDDNVARGFVTVDVVNQSAPDMPTTAGYFENIASDHNALWGDVLYVDFANDFAQSERAIHIEASDTDSRVTTAGTYTFYARLVGGDATDIREPVASLWAAHYDRRTAVNGETQVIYWRDPRAEINPFPCGTLPAPYPLQVNQLVGFDQFENPLIPTVIEMPYACGRADLSQFQPEFDKGWIFFNLSIEDATHQSVVFTISTSEGRFSGGLQAVPLNNLTDTDFAK